jgi:ELWxxDGT repeat protein
VNATVQTLESRVLMSASLIKDINPGAPGSQIQNAVTLNNDVYFAANDGVHGEELWKSDGTAAGTMMLDDINPGPGSSNPADLTVVGNSIYFTANDGVHGTELWITNGTAASTTMVADINPGAASSNPNSLTLGGGYRGFPLLYFMATGSDGTPQVYDAIPRSTPAVMEISKGLTNISDLTSDGGPAFFSATDVAHGTELWTASPYSAAAVIDINPGPGSSNPTDLTTFNNSLYFSADDGTHGRELWEASSPIYFSLVDDIDPGPASSNPTGLYAFNNVLYFSTNGQLWETRGDDQSTVQITVGPQFSHVTFAPLSYTSKGNTIYFASYDSDTGHTELWQTDGTAAGTVQTAPGLQLDNSTPQLYATESEVYFLASPSSGPDQLYQATGDGTGATLADPSEQASGWSPHQILGLANTTLLFSATDSVHGTEPWGIQIPSIATATFLDTDTTTHGTFLQTYGFDGFITPNENALPPDVQFSTENASTYDWAPVTNDVRALQEDYPMSANPFRDAPCYYSASQFSLDLNLTDGLTHQVALYLVDYDNLGRSETVQVSDAISGQVLSTQNVNNFAGGKWLVYSMTGDVKITFINDGGVNAVVSALCVGEQFNPPISGTGSYVTTNATLGGNWVGTYGSGGYDVLGSDSRNIPASIAESGGGTFWEWQYNSTDARALSTGAGSVAFCMYSATSFTYGLSFNDGKPHQLALYLVDFDDLGRVETVQLSDSVSGKVLDSRTVSHFQGGEYLVYNVSGDVTITFINDGPQNAVLSGLFIDPVSTPSGTASFAGTDAQTHGNYTGFYGGDGYDVFNAASSLPSYASLSIPSSVSNYTWDPNATSVNALQTSPGATTRIAACDYSNSPAFTMGLNLTDGKTHKVAIYVLDYDYQHRAETIQITDAITGNLLDSENVSNFTGGKYLVWNLSGDVNITIVNAGGLNEVASGIFFG